MEFNNHLQEIKRNKTIPRIKALLSALLIVLSGVTVVAAQQTTLAKDDSTNYSSQNQLELQPKNKLMHKNQLQLNNEKTESNDLVKDTLPPVIVLTKDKKILNENSVNKIKKISVFTSPTDGTTDFKKLQNTELIKPDIKITKAKIKMSSSTLGISDRIHLGANDCESDNGYNSCTDILEFEPVGRANLSLLCEQFEGVYVPELVDVERGEYEAFLLSTDGSGMLIQYFVVCGDGYVVSFMVWISHVTEEDVIGMIDTINDGREILSWAVSGATGATPWGAFLDAFVDAVNAEDYRFDDHDGDGVPNVNDEDYDGPLYEGENTWFKNWLKETWGSDDDDSEEESEEESDTEDDDESGGEDSFIDPGTDLPPWGPLY